MSQVTLPNPVLFLLPLLHCLPSSIPPLLYPPKPYLKCFQSTGHLLTPRPITPWAMALGVFSPICVSRPLITVRIYLVCLAPPANLPHRNLGPDRPPVRSGLPYVHVYHVCLAQLCLGRHTAPIDCTTYCATLLGCFQQWLKE